MTLDDFFSQTGESWSKYIVMEEPDPQEISELITRLKHLYMITIFARCEINYEGRAKSKLSIGDRLILIKPDGTLLVHEDKKREPINWQPPGSKIINTLDGEKLKIVSKRDKPREILEINIYNVFFIAFARVTRGHFELIGSEKSMVDAVMKNPSIIEEGLKIVRREANTPFGYVDLVGIDRDGNTVLMEFKRGTATLSAVMQLIRYIEYYSKFAEGHLRGIIVAPDITDYALFLLKSRGLEFRKVNPKDLTE